MSEVIPFSNYKKPEGKPKKASRWKNYGSNVHGYKAAGTFYVKKKFLSLGYPKLEKKLQAANLTTARLEAQIAIQEHIALYSNKPMLDLTGRARVLTVGDVIDEILEKETPRRRFTTQANHRLYLGKVKEKFGILDIKNISTDLFEDWIKKEREKGERRTFCDYAKAMSLTMTYARKKKYVPYQLSFRNPDTEYRAELINKKIHEQKTGKKLLTDEEREILELKSSRVLSREEINSLWAVFDENTRDLFTLSYCCFLRLREALQAPWSEIDLETGRWVIPPERVKTGSKTGKGKDFIMGPYALARLRARYERLKWVRDRHQKPMSAFVFPGWSRTDPSVDKPANKIQSAWLTAKENAGILERLRWHDIRHTAITHALMGDASLPEEQRREMIRNPIEVSEYAGVSLAVLQRVYLHGEGQTSKAAGTSLWIVPPGAPVELVTRCKEAEKPESWDERGMKAVCGERYFRV